MAGAIAQDRESCQFPFVLDEKPTVVWVGSAGERSGGAQEVPYGAARSNSERAAPSAWVGRAVFGCQIIWNRFSWDGDQPPSSVRRENTVSLRNLIRRRLPLQSVRRSTQIDEADVSRASATSAAKLRGLHGAAARADVGLFGRSRALFRCPKRLHSAVPNCLGRAPGGKKFDQSFRTFDLSRAGHDGG
jgi:hypothetical protein